MSPLLEYSLFLLVLALPTTFSLCYLPTKDEIGSNTTFNRQGLLTETFSRSSQSGLSDVLILDYNIVCLAQDSRRDTYHMTSIVIRYRRDRSTTVLTEQFHFFCVDGRWDVSYLGNSEFALSDTGSSIGNLTTPLRRDCKQCIDFQGRTDTQHCIPCDIDCNEGYGWCNRSTSCCNYFSDDKCVASCNTGVVLENYNCGCETLEVSNANVTYSNGRLVGSRATYNCINGYVINVDTSTRTCTNDGWTAPNTMACIPGTCTPLVPGNGLSITYSSSNGCPNGLGCIATYSCDDSQMIVSGRDTTRTCENSGIWTGTTPQCIAKPALGAQGLPTSAISGISVAVVLFVIFVGILFATLVVIMLLRRKNLLCKNEDSLNNVAEQGTVTEVEGNVMEGTAKAGELTAKEVEGTAKAGEVTVKEVEGTAKAGEATVKEVEGTAKAGEATVKEVEVEGTAKAGEATVKEVEGTAEAGEATVKEVEGTAEAGEATVKEVEGTAEAGEATVKAGEATVKEMEGTAEAGEATVKAEEVSAKEGEGNPKEGKKEENQEKIDVQK